MDKVSFVCTSYRRFTCVERIIAQYYAQTHSNKELIILNTDMDHQFTKNFVDPNIKIYNSNTDYVTGLPYQNRGQICRDAVTHASGDYFMLADDDDIYFPWHMEQAVDGIKSNGLDAWKPARSLFAQPTRIIPVQNTLEASCIVKMNRIREIGFRMDMTGYEGLSWYTQLRDEGQLNENEQRFFPSYVFNWSDASEIAGHKQSGNIGHPNNFEDHKKASVDYATRPLERLNLAQTQGIYLKYFEWFSSNHAQFDHDHFVKYAQKHITI